MTIKKNAPPKQTSKRAGLKQTKKSDSIKPTANNADLSHEQLTSLINSMADGVLATDKTGRIAIYNGAALNILDINSSLEGKNINSICRIIDKNNQAIDLKSYVLEARSQKTSRDLRLVYPDESTINLYISIAPVSLGYGKGGQQGFVMLLRDITHEKSLEEERDEFISVVSHELRTPIAIAEGNVGNAEFIVEKSGGSVQVQKALKQARTQIMFLSSIINDLSTLSRAERGALTLEIEPINAHDLVQDLADAYKDESGAKGLVIKTDLDPELELLRSSKLYVREILQNFVTNAIKYTKEGSVTIGAEPAKGGVLFQVHDSGIGISKTDQEKVFDKFFRSEDYRTREVGGTGLGLYVTMKLARLIHADISLISEINKGSTFSIFIPDLD